MSKKRLIIVCTLIIELTIVYCSLAIICTIKKDNCDINRDGMVNTKDLQIVHKRILDDHVKNNK